MSPERGPALVIHAGAGGYGQDLRESEAECRDALRDALMTGRALLDGGAEATDVVTAAVTVLESFPLFNAGYGAALCCDESVQLSAAVMRGSDRGAGAVAGLRRTTHPILAAAHVMASEQVLMIGEEADGFAAYMGAEQSPNVSFVTERQLAKLRAGDIDASRGTVGAVCLDVRGGLAAATSTGGVHGQPPGRVGDSPLIGAGTWADAHVAVSCTGTGETFIRVGVARQIAMLVQHGTDLATATETTMAEIVGLGGYGGLIALGADGRAALPFSTGAMPRGVVRGGREPEIWLGPDAAPTG